MAAGELDEFEKKITLTDEQTSTMLYQGCSLSQLERLFKKDKRDIKLKIEQNGVSPAGMRAGFPIYHIREVAPYLVKPPYDMDQFIQKMSVADLPFMLRKEFWAGRKSQQDYELKAGELWPTQDVVDGFSEVFKTLKLSILLMRETVERETNLTPKQRAIMQQIIDNGLEELYAKTVSKFSERKQPKRRAKLSDPEPEREPDF